MSEKLIECAIHGKQKFGLLCTHLAHNFQKRTKIGFHQYDDGDLGRPDAWCDECNNLLQAVETEKEQEDWFLNCDYKFLCVCCWDEAKEINQQDRSQMFTLIPIDDLKIILLSNEILTQKSPKNIVFPFPKSYRNLVKQIKTTEISADCILYNSQESDNESKEFNTDEYWCFGGDGQGNRWLMNMEGMVYYYDHDYDESFDPMEITFEQWLQMANLCKQMDGCTENNSFKKKEKKLFIDALNQIHPNLSENFPYLIE